MNPPETHVPSCPMSGPARARSHVERREARSKKSKSKSTMRCSKKGRGQRCRSRRSRSSNKFGKQNNLRNLQLNFRNRHFNSRSNRCVARCVQRHPEPTARDLICGVTSIPDAVLDEFVASVMTIRPLELGNVFQVGEKLFLVVDGLPDDANDVQNAIISSLRGVSVCTVREWDDLN